MPRSATSNYSMWSPKLRPPSAQITRARSRSGHGTASSRRRPGLDGLRRRAPSSCGSAAANARPRGRRFLQLSLKGPVERRQALNAWQRNEAADNLGPAHIHFAVRRVARELDGAPPQTPAAYSRVRDQLVESHRRRGMAREQAERKLPTANQLITWARAGRPLGPNYWDDVLAAAGYEPVRVAPSGERPRRASTRPRGFPKSQAIVHFVRMNGYWPGSETLRVWAAEANVALERHNVSWRRERGVAEALLRADGVDVATIPDAPTGRGNAASWVFPADGIPGAPTRQDVDAPAWSHERLVTKLREFDQLLPTRERRSQPNYRQLLPEHPDWPPVSSIIRGGGWRELINEAMQLNADGAPVADAVAVLRSSFRSPDRTYEDIGDGLVRSTRRTRTPAKKEEQTAARAHEAPTGTAKTSSPARRRRPATTPVAPPRPLRRRGRRSSARLADLVEAGLLSHEERLIGARNGERWSATFDAQTEAINIDGVGAFASLTAAAMHCCGQPTNGWQFWAVERDGVLVRLAALRAGRNRLSPR